MQVKLKLDFFFLFIFGKLRVCIVKSLIFYVAKLLGLIVGTQYSPHIFHSLPKSYY